MYVFISIERIFLLVLEIVNNAILILVLEQTSSHWSVMTHADYVLQLADCCEKHMEKWQSAAASAARK